MHHVCASLHILFKVIHAVRTVSYLSVLHSVSSGITVIFRRGASTPREIVWYLVIGLGLACCVYLLLRPPWWSRI